MTRLFQKLEAGEMALGVWLKSGPTWVSTIAQAGFDFVRIVMLAMTDLSKALGHAFQYDHEEVWKTLDSIVGKAKARGMSLSQFAREALERAVGE